MNKDLSVILGVRDKTGIGEKSLKTFILIAGRDSWVWPLPALPFLGWYVSASSGWVCRIYVGLISDGHIIANTYAAGRV